MRTSRSASASHLCKQGRMPSSDVGVIRLDRQDGEKLVDKPLPRRSMPGGRERHTYEELSDGDGRNSQVVAIVDDVMKGPRATLSAD